MGTSRNRLAAVIASARRQAEFRKIALLNLQQLAGATLTARYTLQK